MPEFAALYDNPASLFFSFFPRSSWKDIAAESNRYERQTRMDRTNQLIAQQRRRRAADPSVVVEDVNTIKSRMQLTAAIVVADANGTSYSR